jgi:transposase
LQEKLELKETELNKLRKMLFGRKSEKLHKIYSNVLQLSLFEEESDSEVQNKPEQDSATVKVNSHKRRKKQTHLPDNLPVKEVRIVLSEEKKKCSTCEKPMEVIGDVTSEALEILPPKIVKIVYVRERYGCKNPKCSGVDGPQVKTAPVLPSILPKSKATESTFSYIISQKFLNAMPLYRISKDLKRYGVNIHRSTMARWVIKLAEACRGLYNLLKDEIRGGPLIHLDETKLQVLKEEGRKAEQLSYMWVMCGTLPGKEAVLYHYSPTRSGSVVKELIVDYSGSIMTDNYGGYNFLDDRQGIEHLKCWAHARRYFHVILENKKKSINTPTTGITEKFLQWIQSFYHLKKMMSEKEGARREVIKAKIKEEFKEYKSYLKDIQKRTPNTIALGKAINYNLKNLPGLEAALLYDDKVMDNNHAENLIRPFVVGRKNWLFSDSIAGAEATAILYSLSRTAMLHEINPFNYFHYIFKQIPLANTLEDLENLLPWNLKEKDINPKAREEKTIITI